MVDQRHEDVKTRQQGWYHTQQGHVVPVTCEPDPHDEGYIVYKDGHRLLTTVPKEMVTLSEKNTLEMSHNWTTIEDHDNMLMQAMAYEHGLVRLRKLTADAQAGFDIVLPQEILQYLARLPAPAWEEEGGGWMTIDETPRSLTQAQAWSDGAIELRHLTIGAEEGYYVALSLHTVRFLREAAGAAQGTTQHTIVQPGEPHNGSPASETIWARAQRKNPALTKTELVAMMQAKNCWALPNFYYTDHAAEIARCGLEELFDA